MYIEGTVREQLEIALEHVLDSGGAQNPVARDLLRKWAIGVREEIDEALKVGLETVVDEDGKITEIDWLFGLFQDLTNYRTPR